MKKRHEEYVCEGCARPFRRLKFKNAGRRKVHCERCRNAKHMRDLTQRRKEALCCTKCNRPFALGEAMPKEFDCSTTYANADGTEAFTRRHERTAATKDAALMAELRQAVGRIEGGMGEDGFRVHRVSVVER